MEGMIESGLFHEKIPYIKHWTKKSKKNLVIFPGSMNLIQWPATDPLSLAKEARPFVPDEYTLYILGYDKNLPMNHTTDQIADEFAQFFKEHIGSATILAISYGGFIAIPFAARYPELTENLLLVTAAHSLSNEGLRLANEWMQLADKEGSYSVLKKSAELFCSAFYRVLFRILIWTQRKSVKSDQYPISTFINAYKHMIDTNLERKKYLSKIKAPTLVIGGNKDNFFSEKIYKETADLIPNAKLIILNSGHMVPMEKAKKVSKSIYDFLL